MNNNCFILAEIGVNHNGEIDLAYELINVAKRAGANSVKFQIFKSNLLVNENTPTAEYQKKNTNCNNQNDLLKHLELSYETFQKIKLYCDNLGIEFIATPFDIESVDFLEKLNVSTYKIGSGDLTNYQLLKKIAMKKKKIILSTGMSNLSEVINSVNYIKSFESNDIVILHCISSYPTPVNEANLLCIKTLQNTFPNIPIGFSDHTLGYHAAVVAVSLGAKFIEKHITLDCNMEGPDHKASLNPDQFDEFVFKVRETEIMLGDGDKKCVSCEMPTKNLVRRSLAINKNLSIGDTIKEEDIISLRPDFNISAIYYENIIGKTIKKAIHEKEFLTQEHIDI